jgi:hypothetical protein
MEKACAVPGLLPLSTPATNSMSRAQAADASKHMVNKVNNFLIAMKVY